MSSDWAWTRPIWHQHFDSVGGPDATSRLLEPAQFNRIFADGMQQHFPDEAFFSMGLLRDSERVPVRSGEAKALDQHRHRFFAAVELEGEVAALFSGCAFSETAWRMWATVVAPQFRRRGIYTDILEGHLGYSRALGFDVVRSEHAPCNNAILIAKLRAGFHVTSLEIDAEHGTSLILTYFHHPEQKKAYLFRCGMAQMSPRMLGSGNGAMVKLREQFCAEPEPSALSGRRE